MDCICITAYKAPEMLSELLDAIENSFYCYVHIDKRSKRDFTDVIQRHPMVHFYSKYQVRWGGYQHLEAILFLLKEAQKNDWNYVHIISGEDYPTVSCNQINAMFKDDDQSYAGYQLAKDKKHHANRRFRYYWFYTRFSWDYKKRFVRWITLATVAIQVPFIAKKRIGKIQEIYWGFIWGDYHKDAISCVLDYIDSHNEFMHDLRWCKIPV